MDTVTIRATTEQLPLLHKISDTIIFIVGVAFIIIFIGVLACATKYCFRYLKRHPRICCSSPDQTPYSRYQSSPLARAIAANRAALVAAAEEGKAGLLMNENGNGFMTPQKNGLMSPGLSRNVSTISGNGFSSCSTLLTPLSAEKYNGIMHADENGNTGQQLGRDKGSESSDMPLLEYKR